MTIVPDAAADYDFAIWGPFDANTAADNCPPTTAPIRCNFAAPPNGCMTFADCYHTGIGNGGTNASEGAMGSPFSSALNVTAGQVYILLVDNFSSSNVGYTFNWGGTATLGCDPVVLPVELDNLSVAILDRQNHIRWTTLTESNNAYFTIEQSIDGVSWRHLHQVSGAGTSTGKIEYRHVDKNVEPQINYYRLSQTDFDGTTKVISIVSADNRGNRTLLKTVNLLGQDVDQNYKGVVIEFYSDGSRVKVIR